MKILANAFRSAVFDTFVALHDIGVTSHTKLWRLLSFARRPIIAIAFALRARNGLAVAV